MLWLSNLPNKPHKIGHTGLTVKAYLDTDRRFGCPVRMHYAVGHAKLSIASSLLWRGGQNTPRLQGQVA